MLTWLNTFSQSTKHPYAPFTLYGKIVLDEKPVENVSIELLKNGQQLKKVVTTKNGKYSFIMNQDTLNRENEYVIHVFKEGTVPKTLVVNTYIPKEEYDDNNFDYVLEITLVPTTLNDIVIQRPSAKIKWNAAESNFGIDQVYAKIIQKEEEKLKRDPDKYLRELADKMKKEEEDKKKKNEEEARKKIEEEARRQMDELAKKNKDAEELAKNTEKENAENALKENLSAIRTELKELSAKTDSVTTKVQKQEPETTLPQAESRFEAYDESMEYERKKARIQLEKRKLQELKKKNSNLAAKYETNNVMSSLLNAVDEHDKRMKNK